MIHTNRRRFVAIGSIAAACLARVRHVIGAEPTMPIKQATERPSEQETEHAIERNIERKNYPHLDAPVGPYVHAVSYNGLLFLSGLTAFNTPAQHQDLVAQTEVVFAQLRSILEAEGTGLESLLKITIFVTEFEDLDRFRAVLFEAYQNTLPASALIQVKGLFLPEIKVEVEAIAALNQ